MDFPIPPSFRWSTDTMHCNVVIKDPAQNFCSQTYWFQYSIYKTRRDVCSGRGGYRIREADHDRPNHTLYFFLSHITGFSPLVNLIPAILCYLRQELFSSWCPIIVSAFLFDWQWHWHIVIDPWFSIIDLWSLILLSLIFYYWFSFFNPWSSICYPWSLIFYLGSLSLLLWSFILNPWSLIFDYTRRGVATSHGLLFSSSSSPLQDPEPGDGEEEEEKKKKDAKKENAKKEGKEENNKDAKEEKK